MAVPDYQSLMLPLLAIIRDGKEQDLDTITEMLAEDLDLTIEDRAEKLPSGKQRKFDNRVAWVRTYLKKAGLLETPGVGKVRITPRGLEVLSKGPPKIDRKFLMQFPEFVEFQKVEEKGISSDFTVERALETVGTTPSELLEDGYRELKAALSGELLERVKKSSSRFFEDLVLDLLVKMGYGGSRKDAERVGRSGDGGIDGVIKEDKLGLDLLYVQAKRWDKGTVGRREVQGFVGSMEGHGAKKGVFLTTSQFTKDARDYANNLKEKKVILIDGEELARLMMDNNVGVTEVVNYSVKKIDADYFSEE